MSKPTQKQKCIAEQAVYGDLKAVVNNHFNSDLIFSIDPSGVTLKYSNGEYPLAGLGAVKPILRPLSDLTKEITHRGYNDDQPFIPLVELAKVLGIKKCSLDIENKFLVNWDAEDDNPYDAEHLGFYDGWPYLFKNRGNNYSPAYPCDFTPQIYDLLHLWHLDTRNLIEQGDAVDSDTLNINPYSVK